jgi:two-component system cell cycle sensor histidine kinase/response regulator CckA
MNVEIETPETLVEQLRAELETERFSRRKMEADLATARETIRTLTLRENYFRHLTEYSLDLITILDADGTIRFESRSIGRELGYDSADYVGKNAFDFVHPDDSPRVMQAFIAALLNHGNTPVLSFRFRHKDGTYRILEGCGNNLLDDPAVAGIVFNSRDVTDKRRLEEQFLQSQKIQAIGQLTGGVAHDFNNILTAIIGYSDLCLQQLPADSFPTTVSNIAEINKAAHRAAALTRQLLAFSRKQVLQARVINLGAVITEMEKMLRRLLGEQIDLLTFTREPLGNIKADLSQVEQVLLNLAVNARDAMPGGGKLTIEASNVTLDDHYAGSRPEVNEGEYVMLAISDNGCGMPPEVQMRIFEPFFTTKDVGKGTGLGLATCYGIVKQSGGHISVYSEMGKGTTFKVYLPRVNEDAEPVAAAPIPHMISEAGGVVLLVEDEPMLRELGLTVLEELGYRVIAAENGVEALRLVEENAYAPIDIVLTDVIMPGMGGKELVERLLPLFPKTKVIFCSGYTEDAIFHTGTLESDVFFLQKPYTVAGLAQKLSEALGVASAA